MQFATLILKTPVTYETFGLQSANEEFLHRASLFEACVGLNFQNFKRRGKSARKQRQKMF